MKIGLPKALLYYYYFPLWKTFFESLGCEVVVSNETTKQTLDKGTKVTAPELCVPMKICSGHVIELLEEKVDYIFLPRMVSIHKQETFCPKFLGLPDMMRYTIPGLEGKMLAPQICSHTEQISHPKDYFMLREPLQVTGQDIKKALKEAEKVWRDFRAYSKQEYSITDAMDLALGQVTEMQLAEKNKNGFEISIGVIGYVYNIYDKFVSMDLLNHLENLNVNIFTFEMLEELEMEKELNDMKKVMFWTFSNKLLGTGRNFYRDSRIDGIIHITAFGCGPDSFVGKLMEIESNECHKPFMTVRVDEHSGQNHLQTRIEAFVDMIKKKKSSLKMQKKRRA